MKQFLLLWHEFHVLVWLWLICDDRVRFSVWVQFACNAHTICDEEVRPLGTGLYPVISIINHRFVSEFLRFKVLYAIWVGLSNMYVQRRVFCIWRGLMYCELLKSSNYCCLFHLQLSSECRPSFWWKSCCSASFGWHKRGDRGKVLRSCFRLCITVIG